jgi:hypothetical protein
MRRCTRIALPIAARFHGAAPAAAGGKKYDLFGYEVDTNTAPWIEKIKKVKHYDAAGEILVEMNVKNCPPDLATYNATLKMIFECASKDVVPVPNESKFCAMMDLIEEMSHRNKVKPDKESWTWVLKECAASGNYRVGVVIINVMNTQPGIGGAPAELVQAIEALEAKAKAEGKEHPAALAKQSALFDSVTA